MTNEGIIGFVIGASIGSIVTYFVVRNKAQQQANDSVEVLRQHYLDKLKKEATERPVEAPRKPSESSENDEPTTEKGKYEDTLREAGYRYSDLSKPTQDKDDKPGSGPKNKENSMIHEISVDEFDADDDEYDKITITWYVCQHILADDEEHRMSTEHVGGDDMLKDFDQTNTKYVRNEALKVDYEIVIDDVNTWMDPEAEE